MQREPQPVDRRADGQVGIVDRHPVLHPHSPRIAAQRERPLEDRAVVSPPVLDAAVVVPGRRVGAAGRSCTRYAGAPTTASLIGPVTRTAIMSAAAWSRGPMPASNPFAARSTGAWSTSSSSWTFG